MNEETLNQNLIQRKPHNAQREQQKRFRTTEIYLKSGKPSPFTPHDRRWLDSKTRGESIRVVHLCKVLTARRALHLNQQPLILIFRSF